MSTQDSTTSAAADESAAAPPPNQNQNGLAENGTGNLCDAGSLLPHHRDQLRASGLTDNTIRAGGIYSETCPETVADILNWSRVPRLLPPAIVFPYHDRQGPTGYSRIKADNPRRSQGKIVKYESPSGRSNEIYLPPNTVNVLNDADVPLLITEGEKKALAADQHEFPCIGLVGVWGWKLARRETLLPALEHIPWQGRDVYIVFDSDIRHNADVQDAETRLATQLIRRGANVKVARLPEGPPDEDRNPKKVGLDDFLVDQGDGGLRALLDDADEPSEPTALQLNVPAKDLDPCGQIEIFREANKFDGHDTLIYWKGTFYKWQDGCFSELTEKEARARLILHLNNVAFKLTSKITSDHLDQLRAQVCVSGEIEPPSWLVPRPEVAETVVAFRNGLLSLPKLVSGQEDFLEPPTPAYFNTIAADYDFTLDAPRPERWLTFLDQLWPSDAESIQTLQEFFGYCLTTNTSLQKILLLVGPRRSGKGTACRILTDLVGPKNVAGPTLASLGTNFGLSALIDKSVAIISDARLSNRTDKAVVTERLLSISGEDAITADRKHRDPITTRLKTRFVLVSNELPDLTDQSGALAGRLILLRLTESWFDRENPRLTEQLREELPGIMLWAIAGWQRLRERGWFQEPQTSRELRRTLDDLVSPVAAFVRECCDLGPEFSVPRGVLYQAYVEWCHRDGRFRVSPNSVFGRDLNAAVAQVGSSQLSDRRRMYTGIDLRRPANTEGAQQVITG